MDEALRVETPRRVGIAAIEDSLRELWLELQGKSPEPQTATGDEHPVVRACVLNLIVFADARDRTAVSESASQVAAHHPGRVIVVLADPESPADSLTAEVSARCYLSLGKRKQICSEQIVINASGNSLEQAHGVVAPLIKSDLPAFLWWRASRFPAGHGFEELTEICDHLIFDSDRFRTSLDGISRLASLVRDHTRNSAGAPGISDLTWTRLTPWRAALAGLYDVPAYRQHLDQVGRVVIECDRPSGSIQAGRIQVSPLLLAGWLGSRLGWSDPTTAPGEKGYSVTLKSIRSNVDIRLDPAPPLSDSIRGVHDGLSHIRLECANENPAIFSVGMRDGCTETSAVVVGQPQMSRLVSVPERSEAELVSEELDILARDLVYEEAIEMASAIAAALAGTTTI